MTSPPNEAVRELSKPQLASDVAEINEIIGRAMNSLEINSDSDKYPSDEQLMKDTERLKTIIQYTPDILASIVTVNHSTDPDNPKLHTMPFLKAIADYSLVLPYAKNYAEQEKFIKDLVLPAFDKLSSSDKRDILSFKEKGSETITFLDEIKKFSKNPHIEGINVYSLLRNKVGE